jgi:uncharacterized protein YcbX
MEAKVVGLWRHPVKSLQGEALDVADIDLDGLRGDRSWGIRDGSTGRILTGRREPRLLEAAATYAGDDPSIALPDGSVLRGAGAATDAALSAWLQRPVSLVSAAVVSGGRAEFFEDPTDDTSTAVEWTMPDGRFVDAMPLLVLTTASLRAGAALHPSGQWDPRRFRPNLLIDVDGDDWVEDGWRGQRLRVGAVEVLPRQGCVRCTMVTRPQPGLDRDLDIYRTVGQHHAGTLGMWSRVGAAGTVRVGDRVDLMPA